MNDCIFCKIIAGELPSWRVYEDEQIFAFLDIHPKQKGHTLVVPKEHCADFLSAQQSCLQSTLEATQKVARAVVKEVEAEGCKVFTNSGTVAGQDVFHLHWHIVPYSQAHDRDGNVSYADGEAQQVADKIRSFFSLDSGLRRNDKGDV